MELHLKFKILKNTAVGIIDSSRIKTTIKYKGNPIPTKAYQEIKKHVKKIEAIINRG